LKREELETKACIASKIKDQSKLEIKKEHISSTPGNQHIKGTRTVYLLFPLEPLLFLKI